MAPKERTGKAAGCSSIQHLLILSRAKRGWSRAKAAKALKVSYPTYVGWERGQNPQVDKYDRIAKHCGVPVLSLVLMATGGEG